LIYIYKLHWNRHQLLEAIYYIEDNGLSLGQGPLLDFNSIDFEGRNLILRKVLEGKLLMIYI
jgi:hypothetical protein